MTREGNGNFLVTPYYAEAGGTVHDWITPQEDEDGKGFKENPVVTVGILRS